MLKWFYGGHAMQVDAAVLKRTCGQTSGHAAKRTARKQIARRTSFIDRVSRSLEREDTLFDLLAGYGVCVVSILYLLGSLARAIF
jgi:hypothetical protein